MDTIDFITVSTLGNAQDFGNLSAVRFGLDVDQELVRYILVVMELIL